MGSLLGKDLQQQGLLHSAAEGSERATSLQELEKDGKRLLDLEELQDDKEAVLVAVSQTGYALEYASERLQGDHDVVLAAVSKRGAAPQALNFAAVTARNDREVVSAAVQEDGNALEHASVTLQQDREIVLLAVTNNGHALEFACEELQDDKEVVLVAVRRHGGALEFASGTLQGDKEVVLTAVSQYGSALEFASDSLKGDQECVLGAIDAEGGFALQWASMDLALAMARDPEIMQKHLWATSVLIISTLSGRSCVYVAPAGWLRFKRDILTFCFEAFGMSKMNLETADLLLDGKSVPDRDVWADWPGMRTGRANELQLVLGC